MTEAVLIPDATVQKTEAPHRTALILAVVAGYLALWATAVVQFGIPGLYLPALAKVPVMYAILLLISRGK